MSEFVHSCALLGVLLNPFLVIVQLTDAMEHLDFHAFRSVLCRACGIAMAVCCVFGLLGHTVFSVLLQADCASFQICGGVLVLIIGLHFVFHGSRSISILRGDSQHLAGAIAVPIPIGPGTISASVLIGQRLEALRACGAIALAVGLALLKMLLLKCLHDYVRPRSERLVERYIEIAGRITALFLGTVAIEMIMRGLQSWIARF